jgi:hypothetical protein
MYPIRGAFVDEATTLVAGDSITVPNLHHSAEVTFVAFFNAAAVGSVEITAGSTTITLTAPAGGGKVFAVRSGIELGDVTSVALDTTALTAGAAKVVLF